MTIESNRSLGGTAAVLTLLGIFSLATSFFHYIFPNSSALSLVTLGVSGLFGAIGIVGFILFLVAMYGFSQDYKEHKIFSNLMYGILFTIIGIVIATVISVLIILLSFSTLFPNLSSTSSSQISASFSKTFGSLSPIFSLVGIIWVVFVVRAFNLLADKSKVPLFRTGAKMLLAGALVNIVIAIAFAAVGFYLSLSLNTLLALLTIGSVVQDVGWVLLAMAYFRIQAPAAPVQAAAPVNVQPASGQVKYCPNCGAPNLQDALYCTRCGQKL